MRCTQSSLQRVRRQWLEGSSILWAGDALHAKPVAEGEAAAAVRALLSRACAWLGTGRAWFTGACMLLAAQNEASAQVLLYKLVPWEHLAQAMLSCQHWKARP